MPRTYKSVFETKSEEYLNWLKGRGRKHLTIQSYSHSLVKVHHTLRAEGLSTLPSKVDEKAVNQLLETRRLEVSEATVQQEMKALRGLLEYCDNNTFKRMGVRWQRPPRVHVHWMTLDEARILMSECETPREHILVHLGMEMGLRSVGMRNIMDEKAKNGWVITKEKNDKWIQLPFHPQTARMLSVWRKERTESVREAKSKGHTEIPDLLLTYTNRYRLSPMSHQTIWKTLDKLGKRAGLPHTNPHTLRRTFGRLTYFNLVKEFGTSETGRNHALLKVSQVLGHSDTKITVRYLGLDMMDIEETLRVGANFRLPEKITPESSVPVVV